MSKTIKLDKILSKVMVFILFTFVCVLFLMLGGKKGYCEEIFQEESIAENYMSDITDILKGFKDYNWKASLGGVVLMTDGDIKAESCTQLKVSKKEYVSINFIYPEIIGIGGAINLKKVGGDVWFKHCVKLDEEARTKLEENFSWLKWIRIDAGGFLGVSPNDGEFYYGVLFKVIQWEL